MSASVLGGACTAGPRAHPRLRPTALPAAVRNETDRRSRVLLVCPAARTERY